MHEKSGKLKISVLEHGLAKAKKLDLVNLCSMYSGMLQNLRAPEKIVKRSKPKILFVVDHKGWCGERLSFSMIKRLPEYECSIARLGDREHLTFDADLYFYRNISWVNAVPVPAHVHRRIVTLVESERVVDSQYKHLFKDIPGVIPLNNKLAWLISAYGPRHIYTPLPNGIEINEFYPAPKYPPEFTVGTAGNFSLAWYDNWKGFSKYIVPACKQANVKLKWCGWSGKCELLNSQSEQVSMDKMGDFYRSLSCFVLMSKSEACSGVTFEAMASGLPVISTKTGWHGEVCTNELLWAERPVVEDAGLVQLAISRLADKICYLKNNPSICRQYGDRARKFTESWSWDNLIPQWRAAIQFYLNRINEKR